MLSIFSDERFIIFPFCAAEDACNDEGGGSSTGRCFFPFLFFWRKAAQKVGSVSATLGNNH